MPAVSRTQQRSLGRVVLLALAAIFVLQGPPRISEPGRAPGLAIVAATGDSPGAGRQRRARRRRGAPAAAPPRQEAGFVTKVVGAAAQGATAALVAAILSACTEPIVNRLLVKRMTFGEAYKEITFKLVSNFFLTTFPTNMLKFPVFEVINMTLSFTALSGSVRGIINGWLFCTLMLPVTNYRFRKSMGWEIKFGLLYQAYIPTVTRDIVYGWARGFVGAQLMSSMAPKSAFETAFVFGLTIVAACIISSPGNEWRGYTLQPAEKKLKFAEYFKPVNYARSTGVGAVIMGIALMTGQLVTPYAEMLFAIAKGNMMYTAGIIVLLGVVVGALKKK